MQLRDRIVVVTGGAAGIGKALCERFHREGAQAVIVADIDGDGARAVARSVGGEAFVCDVASATDVAGLVAAVERNFGPIDLYCSNAGMFGPRDAPGNAAGAPEPEWQRAWSVNVMAHIHAARVLLPAMTARGGGAFLITVSAAGLLSQIGNAVYSTTKHAALGFAESLAIAHRDDGIRVFALCPEGVDIKLLRDSGPGPQHGDGVLAPEDVAQCVVAGLARENFLILPHPRVADYMRRKAGDYDRWLAGMAKLRRTFGATSSTGA
jgi:NAD(P)-dependent dehydrogenase (short-subunit alcohol dehydrogenase family)